MWSIAFVGGRKCFWATFIGGLGLLAGCAVIWTFDGRVEYRSLSEPQDKPYPSVVAVLPPTDKRTDDSYNHWWYWLIPGVLYFSQGEDRLEEGPFYVPIDPSTSNKRQIGSPRNFGGYPHNFLPSRSLQAGMLREFKDAKLFARVGPVETIQDAQGADFVIRSRLKSTRITMSSISYGLSVASAFLWILGFPMASISQELTMEIDLVKPEAPEQPLWAYTLDESSSGIGSAFGYGTGIVGKYGSPLTKMLQKESGADLGPDDTWTPILNAHQGQLLNDVLADGMKSATRSLRRFLAKQPSD